MEVRHQTRAKIIHRAAERCLRLNPASSLPAGRGRAGCVAVPVMGEGRGEAAALGLGAAPWGFGLPCSPQGSGCPDTPPGRGLHRARSGARSPARTEPLTRARGCGHVSPMSPCLPEANGVEMNPGREAAVFSRRRADSGGKSAMRRERGAERTGGAALSLRGPTAARGPPAGNRCEAGGAASNVVLGRLMHSARTPLATAA